MKEGYSKIRNRAIASAFSYMKIIERWGSGIPRILRECQEYGLREPEFIDLDGDFRVNLYRRSHNGNNNVAHDSNQVVNAEEQQIIDILSANPRITQMEIQKLTMISLRSVKRIMTGLQQKGLITRKGSNRSGEWRVKN